MTRTTNMSPWGLKINLTIPDMLDAADETERFIILGTELLNQTQPQSEDAITAIIFKRLDAIGDFYDSEVGKIGHPLSADELKDIIKRAVDVIEKEVMDGKMSPDFILHQ